MVPSPRPSRPGATVPFGTSAPPTQTSQSPKPRPTAPVSVSTGTGVSVIGVIPPAGSGTDTSASGGYQYIDTPPGNTDIRFPHGTISRTQILLRTQRWVAEQVPYSQVAWWSDGNGIYRQDCSGYVSMAWGLDQDTDFWTGNLNTVSHVIDPGQLLPGDILLSTGHTVLFAGWANTTHTLFDFYEESHTGTDARFVVDAPLTEFLVAGFTPFRYDGVIDTPKEQLPRNPAVGLDFAALQLGSNELAPNGNAVSEPAPASWQAGYVSPDDVTSSASPSAAPQAPATKAAAAVVAEIQPPLPFVLGAAGAVFVVGSAVIARGKSRLASNARRPQRRH